MTREEFLFKEAKELYWHYLNNPAPQAKQTLQVPSDLDRAYNAYIAALRQYAEIQGDFVDCFIRNTTGPGWTEADAQKIIERTLLRIVEAMPDQERAAQFKLFIGGDQ